MEQAAEIAVRLTASGRLAPCNPCTRQDTNIRLHLRILIHHLQSLQRLPFKNWMVVAIDEQLRDYCKEKGINHYYRPVVVSARSTCSDCIPWVVGSLWGQNFVTVQLIRVVTRYLRCMIPQYAP